MLCPCCKKENRHVSKSGRVRPYCASCGNLFNRLYYKKNKFKVLKKCKSYRKNNRGKIAKYHREYFKKHRNSIIVRIKDYQSEHRERYRELGRKYYNMDKRKYRKMSQRYRNKNRKKVNDSSRKSNLEVRLQVLSHYSGGVPKCSCCGESNYTFLSLDHINGGGRKHRRIVNTSMPRWAKNNGFPPIFRVLCHNCNMSYGFYGDCPHKNPNIMEQVMQKEIK